MPLHTCSDLSSNEAIEQRCAAGFGAAFPSLSTRAPELDERARTVPGAPARSAIAPMARSRWAT